MTPAEVARAQLAQLAEHAALIGVDEMIMSKAGERQIAAMRQLDGATVHERAVYSVAHRCHVLRTVVRVAVDGVTFVAVREHFATAEELQRARQNELALVKGE